MVLVGKPQVDVIWWKRASLSFNWMTCKIIAFELYIIILQNFHTCGQLDPFIPFLTLTSDWDSNLPDRHKYRSRQYTTFHFFVAYIHLPYLDITSKYFQRECFSRSLCTECFRTDFRSKQCRRILKLECSDESRALSILWVKSRKTGVSLVKGVFSVLTLNKRDVNGHWLVIFFSRLKLRNFQKRIIEFLSCQYSATDCYIFH